jgi:hypothetical protein
MEGTEGGQGIDRRRHRHPGPGTVRRTRRRVRSPKARGHREADLGPADLALRARHLAESAPLSALAAGFVECEVAEQLRARPFAELGAWAGEAFVAGYSLRLVEEEHAGLAVATVDHGGDLERLDATVAAGLRAGDAVPYLLGDPGVIFRAVNRIIASVVENRLDHHRHHLADRACSGLQEYLTWWVVQGYAVRVAETTPAAGCPDGATCPTRPVTRVRA